MLILTIIKLLKILLKILLSEDGIIEAMHLDNDNHWVFAVQWHPEQQVRISDDFIPLFTEFVKQAKIYRKNVINIRE